MSTPPTFMVLAAGAGSPPPFNPSSIPGLIGSYDFSDSGASGSVYTDTARTAHATNDGDNLKGVTDLSTNAKHLTEATNPPVLKLNILNGRAIARFTTASNQKLSNAAWSGLSGSQACTICAVVKYATIDVTSANHGIVDLSDTGSTNRGPSFFLSANNSPTQDISTFRTNSAAGGAAYTYNATTTGNVWVAKESASRRDLYLDGASVANEVAAKTYIAPVNLFVGSLVGTVFPSGLDIGQVLIYDSALSDGNRNLVEAYLKARWGTP